MSKKATTSKNNPNLRKKNVVYKKYNDREVIPALCLPGIDGKRYMIATYKGTNEIVRDANNNEIKFNDI